MASRQNRETRKEYPTGHNKGNDSPDRSVPTSYGSPMGVPPVVDDTAEREALLSTEVPPDERAALIDETISDSQSEARRRAQDEADNRPTEAPEVNPTADLTAAGAARNIRDRQQQTEDADR